MYVWHLDWKQLNSFDVQKHSGVKLMLVKNKCPLAGVYLDFLPPANKGGVGSVTDMNCSELSQPEMSITLIKFKIQCSFRTSFLNYSKDNFF